MADKDKLEILEELRSRMIELDHIRDYCYPEKWQDMYDWIDKKMKELK